MTEYIPYTRESLPEGWIRPRPPGYYERQKEAQRKRRAKNPDKVREIGRASENRRRYKRYGITEEIYLILCQKQNNLCAICQMKLNSNKRKDHVDHCHETGRVRGILCHHCNLMLGHAKDSVLALQNGIKYLERYKNE